MGDKIEFEEIRQRGRVNTVPGHLGVIEDADACGEDRRPRSAIP